jgi:hypothetical protein
MREDVLTLQKITAELNHEGDVTHIGSPWTLLQVKRVLERSAIATSL